MRAPFKRALNRSVYSCQRPQEGQPWSLTVQPSSSDAARNVDEGLSGSTLNQTVEASARFEHANLVAESVGHGVENFRVDVPASVACAGALGRIWGLLGTTGPCRDLWSWRGLL